MMLYAYAVVDDYGEYHFETEKDAITAFMMLASYHSMSFDKDTVETYIRETGRYERFPLVIYKGV